MIPTIITGRGLGHSLGVSACLKYQLLLDVELLTSLICEMRTTLGVHPI